MSRLKTGLMWIGVLLMTMGVALMFVSSQPALAQEETPEPAAPEEAAAEPTPDPLTLDYEGSRECQDCHRNVVRDHADSTHALALQEVGRNTTLLGDFTVGEDVRQVQLPDEDARAFTADDVAYAIGSGQHAQAYLVETERNTYRVLPAMWNIDLGQWVPITLADSWDDPAYDFTQSCAGCHTTGFNAEQGEWVDDGVLCEACHGPAEHHLEVVDDAGRNPDDAELAAIRASINPGIDPQICGACHSQGELPEGAPAFVTHFRPGLTLAVEGVYTPFGPDDPVHFYPTGHASTKYMQYNEWLSSAHPNSLETLRGATDQEPQAECLACHAGEYTYVAGQIAAVEAGDRDGLAPEALTVENAQFGVMCITCHDPHSESELPDLLLAEPYQQCTSCHQHTPITDGLHYPVKEMFEGISLIAEIQGVPSAHFIAEDGPTCTTCHMGEVPIDVGGTRSTHTMSIIAPGTALDVEGLTDTCSECHVEQASPAALQALIDDTQNGIRARIEAVHAAMPRTAPEWAVAALEFLEGDGSDGIHNYVYADAILDVLEADLGLVGR